MTFCIRISTASRLEAHRLRRPLPSRYALQPSSRLPTSFFPMDLTWCNKATVICNGLRSGFFFIRDTYAFYDTGTGSSSEPHLADL